MREIELIAPLLDDLFLAANDNYDDEMAIVRLCVMLGSHSYDMNEPLRGNLFKTVSLQINFSYGWIKSAPSDLTNGEMDRGWHKGMARETEEGDE
jgi:hypothetical protein